MLIWSRKAKVTSILSRQTATLLETKMRRPLTRVTMTRPQQMTARVRPWTRHLPTKLSEDHLSEIFNTIKKTQTEGYTV